jgi:hypothetical protein
MRLKSARTRFSAASRSTIGHVIDAHRGACARVRMGEGLLRAYDDIEGGHGAVQPQPTRPHQQGTRRRLPPTSLPARREVECRRKGGRDATCSASQSSGPRSVNADSTSGRARPSTQRARGNTIAKSLARSRSVCGLARVAGLRGRKAAVLRVRALASGRAASALTCHLAGSPQNHQQS